jgi:hypothetical protein
LMSNITTRSLRWLQVEISSLCQAGCIDCNRWRPAGGYAEWDPGEPTEWLQNSSYYHMNTYYDLDAWRSHIVKFDAVRHVQFCGNMGDPMSHPQIVECARAVKLHKPECVVDISTNGAIGRVEHYQQLARLGVTISFAVDGLEDTNHIYRRGVSWPKLVERMRAFIDSGGKAYWQWIDFPHTRHQMERARSLSKQWGFDGFDLRQRFTATKKFDISINMASKQPVQLNSKHSEPDYDPKYLEQNYLEQLSEYSNHHVYPQCVTAPDSSWYHPCPHINVDGTMWPCCFTSTSTFHSNPSVRRWWKQLTQHLDDNWNNLHYHSPSEIVQSEFWQTILPNTWKDKTNVICLNHCGKCLE